MSGVAADGRPLRLGLVSAALAAAVLGGSYAWLAAEHGTAGLWGVTIHESGRYTLAQTVFFVRHFLREVPVDVAMALCLAATYRASGLAPAAWPTRRRRSVLAVASVVGAAVLGGAFVGAAREEGASEAFRDFLQFRTRDDVSAYGSHWHYHWLHVVWFCAAGPCVAAFLRRVSPSPGGLRTWAVAWGFAAAVTAVFGLTAEVFLSVRYTGHQAREILTHALVTAPVAWFVMERAVGAAPAAPLAPGAARRIPVVSGALTLAIPAYLAFVVARGDLSAESQTSGGTAGMVAGHFFEHVLDYVFTACVAVVALALPGRTSSAME